MIHLEWYWLVLMGLYFTAMGAGAIELLYKRERKLTAERIVSLEAIHDDARQTIINGNTCRKKWREDALHYIAKCNVADDKNESLQKQLHELTEERNAWEKQFHEAQERVGTKIEVISKLLTQAQQLMQRDHDMQSEIEGLEHERNELRAGSEAYKTLSSAMIIRINGLSKLLLPYIDDQHEEFESVLYSATEDFAMHMHAAGLMRDVEGEYDEH